MGRLLGCGEGVPRRGCGRTCGQVEPADTGAGLQAAQEVGERPGAVEEALQALLNAAHRCGP